MTMDQDKDETQNAVTARTTRVCIKNVPPSFITAEKLTRHLLQNSSTPLIVTDCKLLTKSKMAFVGFKTSDMALYVVKRFNKTYATTSKLLVEPAFSQRNREQHRPWSKHSKGSSRYEAIHGHEKEGVLEKEADKNKEESDDIEEESDQVKKRKEEFLQAMMMGSASSKRKVWSNNDEDDVAIGIKQQETKRNSSTGDSSCSSDSSSDDDSVRTASSNDSVDSGGKGADVLNGRRSFTSQGITDMEFLKSKMTNTEDLDETNEEKQEKKDMDDGDDDSSTTTASSSSISSDSSSSDQEEEQDEKENHDKDIVPRQSTTSEDHDEPSHQSQQQQDSAATSNTRLFCRNLPFSTTEEELRETFQEYGQVVECHIAVDDLKRNKGFAFVSFSSEASATRARNELDGTDFQGRLLHIIKAKKRPEETSQESQQDGTYKDKVDKIRKQNASETMAGANASFVRGDAVVDNLSERLGLNKGDILSVKDGLSSGDAAVRLALGETHIIEENREYFRNEGIDMEALVSYKKTESSVKRSSTGILVKNLPYDTTLEDMTKLFHGVGGDVPQRILLPPSRTIALVQYGHAVDARRAFKKLAYRRFKHVPLYLEWAPVCATNTEDGEGSSKPKQQDMARETKILEKDGEPLEEEVIETGTDLGVSHSIYIKNLNFATTEEELRRVFVKHVKSIRAVKIPTRAAPIKKGGAVAETTTKSLSLGYGFVECDSDESVRKAIKALQGTIVNGHVLELKRSSKQLVGKQHKAPSNKNPTKLMVRNVPFQATRKELIQLFGSFGQLKKVRLPKKFDGSHRGFAFVEFLTGQEALTAMNTLSRTHLYGRHLVLEWASDKEDMVELRAKAKRDVLGSERQNKKIRFE